MSHRGFWRELRDSPRATIMDLAEEAVAQGFACWVLPNKPFNALLLGVRRAYILRQCFERDPEAGRDQARNTNRPCSAGGFDPAPG